jgi:hypothetical protein
MLLMLTTCPPVLADTETPTLSPTPPPMSVNLPLPTRECKELITGNNIKVVNADSLGLMYASALKLNGVVKDNKVTASMMIQSFSDVMGCFIKVNNGQQGTK